MLWSGIFLFFSIICPPSHTYHVAFDQKVQRIDKFEDIYGVLLETKVVLQKFHNEDNLLETENVGNIDIVASGQKLLEFKLVNRNTVLFCTANGCMLCSQSSTNYPYCFQLGLKPLFWTVATTHQNKLYLAQTVADNDTFIWIYETSNSGHSHKLLRNVLESRNTREDNRSFGGAFTVDGFVYVIKDYFKQVGSKKQYVPMITRFCVDDLTENLGSRVKLSLSCKVYGTRTNETNFLPTAFTFDEKENKLYVAFVQIYSAASQTATICEFDFAEMRDKFEQTWKHFQATDSDTACIKTMETEVMPEKCYIKSVDNSCESSSTVPKVADKLCDNYRNIASVKCGNLLYQRLIIGHQVFESKNPFHFVAIQKTATPNIMLSTTSDNMLMELIIGDKHRFNSTPVPSTYFFYDSAVSKSLAYSVSGGKLRNVTLTNVDLSVDHMNLSIVEYLFFGLVVILLIIAVIVIICCLNVCPTRTSIPNRPIVVRESFERTSDSVPKENGTFTVSQNNSERRSNDAETEELIPIDPLELYGQRHFKSCHGTYLRAEYTEMKVSLTYQKDTRVRWEVQKYNGLASFKAIDSPGKFLTALPTGDVILTTTHPQDSEASLWKPIKKGGKWLFRSTFKKYLSARKDKSVTTVSTCDVREHWTLEEWSEAEVFIPLPLELYGQRYLRSFHGTYLRAEDKELKVVLTDRKDTRVRWEVQEYNGFARFKTLRGKFLTALQTGNVILTTVYPLEDSEASLWKPIKKGEKWSFLSKYKQYLSAREDKSVTTVSNCDEWEHWSLEEWSEVQTLPPLHPLALYGQRYLRSFHGTYLRAEDKELKVDLTDRKDAWEKWYIQEYNGLASIKAIHSPGKFLKALPNGKVILTTAHPLEDSEASLWKPIKKGEKWSFLSKYKQYLSAREDKSVTTVSNCDEWEEWSLEEW